MQQSFDIVVRERIRRRVEELAAHRVAVIAAPGGFGKSVALAQLLALTPKKHVRCVVSPADSTLNSFARRLLVQLAIDDAARETLEEALEAERSAEDLAQLFARNLEEYDGVIAVDDFHYATGESTPAFLVALVDATTSHVQWAIATRSHKELPIAEWIARGTCARPISADELAFTLDEATASANALSGICPDEDIQKILALRNFPLAFILAIRFARAGGGASQLIAQARELTYDYLARHVYDLLTADEQRHLQFGVLLRAFDCDLFEEAGFSSARRVLQRLYRKGSFLVLGDGPDVYSCNDVFLDFLEEQLRLCSQEEQRALKKMAADVLTNRNRDIEAMALYAQAQEYQSLLSVLRRRGFEFIGEGQREFIRGTLDCIPRELRDSHAISLALEAQLFGMEERFTQAKTLFLRAMEISSDEQERIEILYRFAAYEKMISVAESVAHFDEIAGSKFASVNLRVGSLANGLLARAWLDPYYDVGKEIDEIEPLIATVEREVARTALLLDLGTAALYAGEERAYELLARAEEPVKRMGFLSEVCRIHQSRAMFALYCDDDLSAARDSADRRIEAGRHLTRTRARRGELVLNMLIAMRAGDVDQARTLLTEHHKLPVTDDASVGATVNRVRAMLAAWDGDYARAEKLLKPILAFVFPFYRPIAHALCTIAGAAAGTDVEKQIDEQVRELRSSRTRCARAAEREQTTRALLAIAATVSGKNSMAKRLLSSAKVPSRLSLILREVARVLSDAGDSQPVAASNALEELTKLGFKDLRLFFAPLFRAHLVALGSTALTDAEIAVLRLLEQGLKPKEIAELRDTSVHTIRKQLQNIRAKLNSHSTDQVLARAHALGVL